MLRSGAPDDHRPRSAPARSTSTGSIFNALGLSTSRAVATGTGHTASCVAGRPLRLPRRHGGGHRHRRSARTRAEPESYVGNFPAEEATGGVASHDVQFDQAGLALDRRLRRHRRLRRLRPARIRSSSTRPTRRARRGYVDEPTNDGSSLNDYIHHNSHADPQLRRSPRRPPGADPEADSDVVLITEEDYNRPTCQGAGSFETWKIGDGRRAPQPRLASSSRSSRRARRSAPPTTSTSAAGSWRRASTSRARASSTSRTRRRCARSATGSRP